MLTVSKTPGLSSPQTVLIWSAYSNSLNYTLYKILRHSVPKFSLAEVNYKGLHLYCLHQVTEITVCALFLHYKMSIWAKTKAQSRDI